MAGLRAEATRAAAEGAAAVFLSEGPLGDPIVLAAGLGPLVPGCPAGRPDRAAARRSAIRPCSPVTSRASTSSAAVGACSASPRRSPSRWPRRSSSAGPCGGRGRWPARARISRCGRPPTAARPAGEDSPLIAFDLTAGDELPDLLGRCRRPPAATRGRRRPTPAGWSGCDGRHPGTRAGRDGVGHDRRHRPASPRPQRAARRGGASAWWPTTCSSAGPRAGTSGSTSSSSSPAS